MVRYTIDKSDEAEEQQEPAKDQEAPEKGEAGSSGEGLSEGVQQLQLSPGAKEQPEDDLHAIARRLARMEGDVRDCRQKQFEMEGKMVRMENWLHGSMDAVLRKLDSVIAGQQKYWASPQPGTWCWPGPGAWQAARAPTLLLAAERGDAEALLRLLAGGGAAADPEQRGARGDTPLHVSAARGDARCVRLLLAAGASPRAPGHRLRTALHCAAQRGHADAARRLLDAGAQVDARDADGATPLALAAAEGRANVVAMLLERGAAHDAADAKGLTPAFHAAAAGHERVLLLLLDKGASVEAPGAGEGEEGGRVSLVAHAAKAGQWGAVRLLLERGAGAAAAEGAGPGPEGGAGQPSKAKAQDESPLALAARAGQGGALRELLRHGAHAFDDEQVEGALNVAATACAVWALAEAAPAAVRGEPGRWALLYAAEDGRLDALVALLEAGVDLAAARDGSGITALHTAAWNGHWTVVRELLLRGADVLWKDGHGDTPLHKAALADRQACVRALLEAGAAAALQEKNKQGETPRDLAASDVVRRMLDEGVASADYALIGGRKFVLGASGGGPLFGAPAGTASGGGTTFGASGGTAFGASAASGTTFGVPAASGATFGIPASSGLTFGGPASNGLTFGAPASSRLTFGAPAPQATTTFGCPAAGTGLFGAASGNSPSKGSLFGSANDQSNLEFGFASATSAAAPNVLGMSNQALNNVGFGSTGGNVVSESNALGSGNEQLNCGYTFGIPNNILPPGNISGLGSRPSSDNGVLGPNVPYSRTLFGCPVSNTVGRNIAKVGKGFVSGYQSITSPLAAGNRPGNSAQNSGHANSLFGTAQLSTGGTVNLGGANSVTTQLSSNGDAVNPFLNAAGNDKVLGTSADKVGRTDNKIYSVYSGNAAKNAITSSGGVQPANSVLNGGSLKRSSTEEGKDGAVSDSSSSTND